MHSHRINYFRHCINGLHQQSTLAIQQVYTLKVLEKGKVGPLVGFPKHEICWHRGKIFFQISQKIFRFEHNVVRQWLIGSCNRLDGSAAQQKPLINLVINHTYEPFW